MLFAIDCGHNCEPDTGCAGIKFEDTLTKQVGNLVIKILTQAGHKIIDVLPKSAKSVSHSLEQRCEKANKSKADVYVSIHFNCFDGNAHGSEVYAMSSAGKNIAERVLAEIVKLGFRNRGIRDGGKFYVVKNTAMPAVLIECCFCDSKIDMKLFSADSMAVAIAEGLIGYADF
jgi:N-acetylmuramoyl-L-alanine amidase